MAVDLEVVQKIPCFHNLSVEQLQAIASISNSICYSPGFTLFKEGEKAKNLYFLIEGNVEVFYKSPEENLQSVDVVSSKEVVGCSAMVPPYIYTATEKCLSEVEVLEIDIEAYRDLIEDDPQIGMKLQQHIIKTLNDRILQLRHRLIKMS